MIFFELAKKNLWPKSSPLHPPTPLLLLIVLPTHCWCTPSSQASHHRCSPSQLPCGDCYPLPHPTSHSLSTASSTSSHAAPHGLILQACVLMCMPGKGSGVCDIASASRSPRASPGRLLLLMELTMCVRGCAARSGWGEAE